MDQAIIESLAAAVAAVEALIEEGAIPVEVAEPLIAALEAVKDAEGEQGAKAAAALLEAVAMLLEEPKAEAEADAETAAE